MSLPTDRAFTILIDVTRLPLAEIRLTVEDCIIDRPRRAMALTTQDKILIEQRVTNESPSAVVAYLLWLVLGVLSGHRFYLGRPGTAVLQIVLNCILIGFVWVLIDIFLIPSMVRAKQAKIRDRLTMDAISAPQATGSALAVA